MPGRVVQSVARLTQEPEVLCSIPYPATYLPFPFRWFKKGKYQLLVKVCALVNRSGGLSLDRKSVNMLIDRPDMTRTTQQQQINH